MIMNNKINISYWFSGTVSDGDRERLNEESMKYIFNLILQGYLEGKLDISIDYDKCYSGYWKVEYVNY